MVGIQEGEGGLKGSEGKVKSELGGLFAFLLALEYGDKLVVVELALLQWGLLPRLLDLQNREKQVK